MPNTRYAQPGDDPDKSPERFLASGRVRGLNIGLNIVTRIARVLSQAERDAMIWLTNFAHLRDLTADALCGELELEKVTIRQALTDPEADRTAFVRAVAKLRGEFAVELKRERAVTEPSRYALSGKFDEALRKIANTLVHRKIGNAVKLALREPQIIEVLGKTRLGKSIAARQLYLENLHQAAWLHCPKPGPERVFLAALAGVLGIGTGGNAMKSWQIEPKITSAFGQNRIRLLFVDEGHRIWPCDTRNEPKRAEFLRDLWEVHGVSVIILATPQYSEAVNEALATAKRWAPGQWLGRVMPFDLPDALSDADLAAVAENLAPDTSAAVVKQLVEHAKKSEGYAGMIARLIERARFIDDGGKVTLESLRDAHCAVDREERTKVLAFAAGKQRRAA